MARPRSCRCGLHHGGGTRQGRNLPGPLLRGHKLRAKNLHALLITPVELGGLTRTHVVGTPVLWPTAVDRLCLGLLPPPGGQNSPAAHAASTSCQCDPSNLSRARSTRFNSNAGSWSVHTSMARPQSVTQPQPSPLRESMLQPLTASPPVIAIPTRQQSVSGSLWCPSATHRKNSQRSAIRFSA